MSVQDAVIFCSENDYRVSPTQQTSRDLSSQSELASSTQEQAEPTAVSTASITGSDSQQVQVRNSHNITRHHHGLG